MRETPKTPSQNIMKTIFIDKTNKEQTLSIQAVRALLKKNGFKIGAWGSNGRISGLGSFYGGDIEVRGNEYDWKYETKAGHTANTFIRTMTKFANVSVIVRSDKVSLKDVICILKKNGLVIQSDGPGRIIVDNK